MNDELYKIHPRAQNGDFRCPYDPDRMEYLIDAHQSLGSSIEQLCTKVEILVTQHRDMVRWLLLVVCIIALGSKALEFGNHFVKAFVLSESATAASINKE